MNLQEYNPNDKQRQSEVSRGKRTGPEQFGSGVTHIVLWNAERALMTVIFPRERSLIGDDIIRLNERVEGIMTTNL